MLQAWSGYCKCFPNEVKVVVVYTPSKYRVENATSNWRNRATDSWTSRNETIGAVLRDNTRVPCPYHHCWNTGDTQDWHESFVTMHVVISRTRTASTPVIHLGAYPLTHTDCLNVCSILFKIHSIHNVVHKINTSIQHRSGSGPITQLDIEYKITY